MPSTMKPTQITYPQGSVNQIPGECTVGGDVRLTPFYDVPVRTLCFVVEKLVEKEMILAFFCMWVTCDLY